MDWTITKIASVVLCAMGAGFTFSCFGYTPVLGYVIAGLLLGPSGLSLIRDSESVAVCSEMGIIFLLFVIGQNLSFERIKNIWKTSMAVVLVSTVCTYLVLLTAGLMFNIRHAQIVLFAFCIALSSTAVTVKSLETLKEKDNSVEENTFGILIAQDLFALVMVIIINAMAGSESVAFDYKSPRVVGLLIIATVLSLCFTKFNKYMYKISDFLKKHNDMISITILGICLGSAVLAELVGFSAPFGAFVAGLILGNSKLSEEVKAVSSPIEEILLMTFFLSVGLLVDIRFVWHNLGVILLALIYVTFGKTILNIFILRLFKFPLKDSFIISVLLGHIGEFSFMLAFAAHKVGIIATTELKFLISITALSLFFSPFWLVIAERSRRLTVSAMTSSGWGFANMLMAKEFRKTREMTNAVKRAVSQVLDFGKQKASKLITHVKEKSKRE